MKTFKDHSKITSNNAAICIVNGAHGVYTWHELATNYELFIELDEPTILNQWLIGRADMPDGVCEVFNPDSCDDWCDNVNYIDTTEKLLVLIDGSLFEVFQGESGDIFAIHPDAIYCEDHNMFCAPLDVLLNEQQG